MYIHIINIKFENPENIIELWQEIQNISLNNTPMSIIQLSTTFQ